MKKVLFISSVSMNLYLFRLSLMKHLRQKKWIVVAAAGKDPYTKALQQEVISFLPLHINRKSLNPFHEIILFFQIIKILIKERPDIIMNFTIKPVLYATLASYFFKVKVIDVITGLGYVFIQRSPLTLLVKFLYRIALFRADKVIFQNKDDFGFFTDQKMVRKAKSSIILGSGIDTDHFYPRKRAMRSRTTTFLFMGRLLKDKGLMEYMEASRRVKQAYPHVKVLILGWFDPGNPASIAKEYLKGLEKERIIKYLGHSRDVRKYIGRCDVVVLPSYREGVPHSLLESASMEKPIITTKAPGCREVVDHKKNGLLVPIKDIEALKKAMIWMIEHWEARIKMGREGRKKMLKEFRESIILKQYEKVLSSIV